MRKQLVALALAGTALAGMFAAPAANAGETATTFTLTAGALSVSAPVSKDLASAAAGAASLSATLGTVTVSDGRGALAGTWSASAASTDFTTGTGATLRTIAKASVSYLAPLPTTVSGTVVPATTGLQTLDAAKAVVTAATITGNNVVSWDPTVTVTLPADATAGSYAGTITHSIA